MSKADNAAAKVQVLTPGNPLLLLVAFASGWAVMMLEMLSGRMLAPFFGYSIYQWGALIGVVLAFMAAGYFVGSFLGDRKDAAKWLLLALTLSLLWTWTTPFWATPFLKATRVIGPGSGAIVASIILVAIPSFLLAFDAPIVAALAAARGIARTAGRTYAVSTVGSIGGTFFAAFYAIPEIGTRNSYFIAGLFILVAIVILGFTMRQHFTGATLAAIGVIWLVLAPAPKENALYSGESVHNIIHVEDVPGYRLLYLNYRDGPQTVQPKNGVLSGSYYDSFILMPALTAQKRILFLGAAGGAALNALSAVWPESQITGVELDGAVIDVAKKYFGVAERKNVSLVEADARRFVNDTTQQFDVVGVDLYVTGHIPFHCVTVEFFQELAAKMSDDGVLLMNVLSIRPGDDLIGPMVETARRAFPFVALFGQGNVMLMASKKTRSFEEIRNLTLYDRRPEVRLVSRATLGDLRAFTSTEKWPVFTDDKNDVDFRSFRMFYSGY